MTTFAIFYNREDLSAIAAEATNPGLTNAERQTANRYWQGGLNVWSSAPTAPAEQSCVTIPFPEPNLKPTQTQTQNPDGTWTLCDSDIRACAISGSQVSKSGLVSFLRQIGNEYSGALYMLAIADDVESTAVEPWP